MIRRRSLLLGFVLSIVAPELAMAWKHGSVPIVGHLLLETGDKLILENGSGFLLLER
jgi:hypothetical protein